MKRNWLPILFALGAFVLASCNLPGSPTSTEDESMETVAPEESMAAEEAMPTEATEAEDAGMSMDTDSVCYHPLFPVTDDATWTYQYEDGKTYTMTVDSTSDATFTLTQEFDTVDTEEEDELVLSMDFYCSPGGLLQGDFAQINLFGDSSEDAPEIKFETVEWTGETLPAIDVMEVGYAWTATYTLQGEFNIEGMQSTADATVVIDYVIAAIEEVTVPAGTFPQAYRVDSTSDIEISLSMGESTMPFSGNNFSSSIWYVEGIGLVKSQDTFETFSSGIELIDSSLIN